MEKFSSLLKDTELESGRHNSKSVYTDVNELVTVTRFSILGKIS